MERELWRILYRAAQELDNPWGGWRYCTADVLAVYFWAVVHDRPTSWAAQPKQWPDDCARSTCSRRSSAVRYTTNATPSNVVSARGPPSAVDSLRCPPGSAASAG